MSTTKRRPPEEADTAVVVFHPQVWSDGRAVTSDDLERFQVPIEDVTDEDGTILDRKELDHLKFHENAPDRARNWADPFYVTVAETR